MKLLPVRDTLAGGNNRDGRLPKRLTWPWILGSTVAGVVGALSVLALMSIVDASIRARAKGEEVEETTRVASSLSAAIERELTGSILLQRGLAAALSANPNMSDGEFAAFGAELLIGVRGVRSIGFSRGTVIAGVFPREGNESALGADYRSLPDQWPAIERAILTRSSVLAGPTTLIQGGGALIGRTPVFASPPGGVPGSGSFVGVVSVLIDVNGVFAVLGIQQLRATYDLALRGVDGLGANGAVFLGDPRLFGAGSVVLDVTLPGGLWQLALSPRAESRPYVPYFNAARWAWFAASALAGLLAFLAVHHLAHRRAARLQVEDREKRLRDFAESSADWFWETDPDYRIVWTSLPDTQEFGISAEKLAGHTCWEIAGEDLSLPRWQELKEDLDNRRAFRGFEFELETTLGRRQLRVNGVPVTGHRGEFIGYRGSATDVTEERDSRARLADALHQAEVASLARSAFLAQMSHELRTPLNAIIGFAEMISSETLGRDATDRYRAYAVDILTSGRHLLSLVNDLLDIARIDAGAFSIEVQAVDVRPLLEKAIHMIVPSAQTAGLAVVLDAPPGPCRALLDPRALIQILMNLLSNAVKFTPVGGRVVVSLRADTGSLVLAVKDTGIGMKAELAEQVLHPFARTDDPFVRARGGTGLGLSICSGLMRLHGGTLEIVSRVNEGTTVFCRFPASATGAIEAPA